MWKMLEADVSIFENRYTSCIAVCGHFPQPLAYNKALPTLLRIIITTIVNLIILLFVVTLERYFDPIEQSWV